MDTEELAQQRKLLKQAKNSLHKLELQELQYGVDVPLQIQNRIEYFKERITQLEREIEMLTDNPNSNMLNKTVNNTSDYSRVFSEGPDNVSDVSVDTKVNGLPEQESSLNTLKPFLLGEISRKIMLQWVGAAVLSFLLIVIASLIGNSLRVQRVFDWILGVYCGTITGVIQWFIMRRLIPCMELWLIFTVVLFSLAPYTSGTAILIWYAVVFVATLILYSFHRKHR